MHFQRIQPANALPQTIQTYADWTEMLIQTIRSRPALYDKSLTEHTDRHLAKILWNEVCEAVVENWNHMSFQDQVIKTKEIQQRWRNVRTCFTKEISKQRKLPPSETPNKRRKYVYYDHLLFLLPTIGEREKNGDNGPDRKDDEEEQQAAGEGEEEEEEVDQKPIWTEMLFPKVEILPTFQSTDAEPESPSRRSPPFEGSRSNAAIDEKEGELDEDKLFLMSLVPSFKKLTYKQKIEAKIEFLNVLKRLKEEDNAGSSQKAD